MFQKIEGPNRTYHGAAFQGYLPGRDAEAVANLITTVIPELEMEFHEDAISPFFRDVGGRSYIYFYNFPRERGLYNELNVSLRVETEPSTIISTRRFLWFKRGFLPHHEFEILAFSKSQPVLTQAIGDLLIRKPDLKIKSKKFSDKQSAQEEKVFLTKRLRRFCEDHYQASTQRMSSLETSTLVA
jgi:hypothetical protein